MVKTVTDWYNARSGGLVLMGGCGCGKTHIARRIVHAFGGTAPVMAWEEENKRWVSVYNSVFYAETDLLGDIRATYRKDKGSADSILRRCRSAKLLILDDVGIGYVKEDSQQWYESIMWQVLDDRAERNLSTMLTTNLTPNELKIRLGNRAFSRLKGLVKEENVVNLFDVPDYRGKDWG